MSTTRAQLISLIEAKTQDAKPYIGVFRSTHGLSDADLIDYLIDRGGAQQISKFIPRILIKDISGAGVEHEIAFVGV